MKHFFSFVLVILWLIHHMPAQTNVEAKIEGFSIELIHRDSKLSPFYNHSATIDELSRNDALRSIARINYFRQSSSYIDGEKIESVTIPDGGEYLMKLAVGSPRVERFAIADTGSDLIWFQCAPCDSDSCYPQDSPIFDPSKSSTYVELSCNSSPCQALPRSACGTTSNECLYFYSYQDRSSTSGILSTDTLTFDSTDGQVAAFSNSVFGCGHENGGSFSSHSTGLVGLGRGSLSLISQLSSEIQQKFSYCLLPRTSDSASKLRFGQDAFVSGGQAVSTPLLSGDSNTFYYLSLESVSVGDKNIPNQASGAGGNIIIDSGTTLTVLESSFYSQIESALTETVGLEPVQDPRGVYKLCFDNNSLNNIPEVTMVFHFMGADITLQKLNIFRSVTSDISCLAMAPTNGLSFYGNWAQMNFQVLYDLANNQLTFAPADCTQY